MRRLKLHWWILIGMAVGALLGAAIHAWLPADQIATSASYRAFDGLATIFLKLLKLIVVPLVFFSLVTGMLGMGDLARLGRIGLRTFSFYILTSMLAILMGLTLVNIVRPGDGVAVTIPTEAVDKEIPDSFWDVLVEMVPDNVIRAAADFDLIGVILFTILFGAFLLAVEGEKKRVLVAFLEGGADVMMKMTGFIISLAPIGIAALIARMVSTTGLGIFWELRWYVVTVFAALSCHLILTLPLLIFFFTRRNPYRFLRAMSPALLTGFSTASSSGTLPVTMDRVENGAGVSNRVASFTLPIGATINMDGTALYELFTVLFIAQVHATIDPTFHLSIGQQVLIAFLGLAVSVGAAGIPHAGLVMMVIILQAVGLPVEYTALIWAIDRPIDMFRTVVNLASDSSIALIVAHQEKEIDESVLWKPV